ncbi:hypothetical protein [Stutzerimonas nitrititolerans]|uniref:hypothetical protein n=1 Tax=Stutzerimonas nitrititolerans TaxID=2482751 RepID=UPI0028A1840A|nr:hypothetical protein [Stutzerimonas nitrititolerans]
MHANRFVKNHGPSIEYDLPRLEVLAHICEQVAGVTTARVLHADMPRQKVVYERLVLTEPMESKIDDLEIMSRVGRLLANMHTAEFTVTPDFSAEPYPLESLGIDQHDAKMLTEALPPGWFHSDFWHGNVFVLDVGNIVVIDPLPAAFMFSRKHILASGALDVAMMYMSLLLVHPLLKQFFLSAPPHMAAAEKFLMSYLEQRDACSKQIVTSLRRVIRCLAEIWVSKLSARLVWPICAAKRTLATKSILAMEKTEEWRKI